MQPWGKSALGKGYKKTDDPSSDETSLPKWNGRTFLVPSGLASNSLITSHQHQAPLGDRKSFAPTASAKLRPHIPAAAHLRLIGLTFGCDAESAWKASFYIVVVLVGIAAAWHEK